MRYECFKYGIKMDHQKITNMLDKTSDNVQ